MAVTARAAEEYFLKVDQSITEKKINTIPNPILQKFKI
jgi:hypothetical protein